MDIYAQIDDASIAIEAIARMGAAIERTDENGPLFDEFDNEIAKARQKLEEARKAADDGDIGKAQQKIDEAITHLMRALELLKRLRGG